MLKPLPASEWNTTTAAHLLNRAGFGGNPTEIENLRSMGFEGAVSWLVDYDKIPDPTPPPDWTAPHADPMGQIRQVIRNLLPDDLDSRKEIQRQSFRVQDSQMAELRYWWLRRMALGPRPLQEKMTLFWHGNFATSFEKVRDPYFLWLQNDTFRQNALGKFNDLLLAAGRDPAMLVYLDGTQSHKRKPNENFAREVMELFALGEGHYTEQDIQQAARAYTGWGLEPDPLDLNRQRFTYRPNDHDDSPKTVFGQTNNFTGEQVLNMICANPQCAKFISARIWRFFVAFDPPKPIVDALAAEFQAHGMDLKHLMGVILRSREFYAPGVIRSQIKSPVQWLIASMHQLQTPLPTEPMSLAMLAQLGQELFQPPNVKGWDGGVSWATTNTLLDRYNFAAALVEGERVPLPYLRGQMNRINNLDDGLGLLQVDPAPAARLFTAQELGNPDAFLAALQTRFLNGSLGAPRLASLRDFVKTRSPLQEMDVRKAIRLLMSTPEYQLT